MLQCKLRKCKKRRAARRLPIGSDDMFDFTKETAVHTPLPAVKIVLRCGVEAC